MLETISKILSTISKTMKINTNDARSYIKQYYKQCQKQYTTKQTMLETISNNTINNSFKMSALPARIAPFRLTGTHAQAFKQSSVFLKANQDPLVFAIHGGVLVAYTRWGHACGRVVRGRWGREGRWASDLGSRSLRAANGSTDQTMQGQGHDGWGVVTWCTQTIACVRFIGRRCFARPAGQQWGAAASDGKSRWRLVVVIEKHLHSCKHSVFVWGHCHFWLRGTALDRV